MSKGLDALEKIGKRKYRITVADITGFETVTVSVKQDNKKDYQTIEKELKRLEEIDDILNTGGGIWAENGIVSKKLKALEIIKKKSVDLLSLHHAFTMDKEGEQSGFEWFNNRTLVKRGVYDTLTQEEYDLLKEVLL